MEIKIDRS